MSLTVAELNVLLLADIRDLQRGLDRAEKEVAGFAGKTTKQMDSLDKGVSKVGKGVGALGGLFATDVLFSFARQAMDAVDATSELGMEWKETQDQIERGYAAIGQQLIPVVADAVDWIAKAAEKTSEWSDKILTLGGSIDNVDKKAVGKGGVGAWLDQIVDFPWEPAVSSIKDVEMAVDTLDSTQKFSGETVEELLGIYEDQNKVLSEQRKATEDAEKAWGKLKDAQMAAKGAAFALEDANLAVAAAQRELNELLATGGVDADKVADSVRDLARANEDLLDANESVVDAQTDLNDALADAAERHLRDVENATEDLTRAQERLADQTQDVADAEAKLSKLKAQRQARDQAIKNAKAQLVAADTITERIIAQESLDAALGMEIVTDQELAAAQSRVTTESGELQSATEGVTQASRDLTTVQAQVPSQFDSVRNAAERLEDAQKRAKTATDGVTAAQNALSQAQIPAPGFAREVEAAQRAVEAANWGAERATWALEKAQRAYNQALVDQPRNVTTTRIINDQVNVKVDLVPVSVSAQPGAGAVVPLQMRPTLVMHDGGMVPGPRGSDVPALLQAGERVIPAGGGSGGGVTINVNAGAVIHERDLPRVIADAIRDGALYGIN